MNRLILFLFSFVFCQQHLDGVLAIVGENMISKGEVMQMAQMTALQNGEDLSQNPMRAEKYSTEALDMLVNQNIFLKWAEEDTLIFVSDDELDFSMNQQVQNMLAQTGSEEALEAALGQSIRSYKRETRNEMYNMLLVEKYQQSLLINVNISYAEVSNFYQEFQDSLPETPALIKYSIIDFPIKASEETENLVLNNITALRDSLLAGSDFADIALKYSEDPGSKNAGGELGYSRRGTYMHSFEEAAFQLEKMEISEPVRTEFGYHLIQLIDKLGEKINTRHILLTIKPTEADKKRSIAEMQKVYAIAETSPESFDSLATVFREKEQNMSGVQGWMELEALPEFVKDGIQGLDKGISYPFEGPQNSLLFVYIHERKEAQKPSLESDYELIHSIALNRKKVDTIENWLASHKDKIFTKIFE